MIRFAMATTREDLPEDVKALKAALMPSATSVSMRPLEERGLKRNCRSKTKDSDDAALIGRQRLQIEKLTRELADRGPGASPSDQGTR